MSKGQFLNISGEKYNRLTAINRIGLDHRKRSIWEFKCDCGTLVQKPMALVRYGHINSCGCLKIEQNYLNLCSSLEDNKAAKNALFNDYRTGARERYLDFNLSFEEFELFLAKNCYYCNSEPIGVYRINSKDSKRFFYNGIDRTNNNKGYSLKNCVTCCKICNRNKGTMNKRDFLNWIKKVYRFQVKQT